MFCLSAYAQLPPMLPVTVGSGMPTGNTFIFVDSASARPNTVNQDSVWTPARNYTGANFIVVQAVDYPSPVGTATTLTDTKSNTYVLVFSQSVSGNTLNQRIRCYVCFNPDISGGNIVLTYASVSGANYPVIYAQAYSGVTSLPSYVTNSTSSTANISSIGTGNVTTATPTSLLTTTFASATNITAAPTVSGSFSISDRMNWFPGTSLRNQYSGSYAKTVSSTGTYNATHTSGGPNFSSQTIAAIIAYQ